MSRHSAALRIEYDGSPFKGWARQPGALTVEGSMREAFSRLSLHDIDLRVAGRTDSGVHAAAQVASVHYSGPIPPERLAAALNSALHPRIVILGATECRGDFDARAAATSRAYEYRVLPRVARSPLRASRVLHHLRPLDRDALDAAAQVLIGQHDFTAFTPAETHHGYFHRTVLESHWVEREDEVVYCIRANAFLRHMVRIIMGTMLAVGRGDWTVEAFRDLLDGAVRSDAHHTAPPHALCLVDVRYGEHPSAPEGWA